jgi:hypothetical protein
MASAKDVTETILLNFESLKLSDSSAPKNVKRNQSTDGHGELRRRALSSCMVTSSFLIQGMRVLTFYRRLVATTF